MKKSLILSAALFAALGANAEVFTYDFYQTPIFCKAIWAPAGEIVDPATELEGLGTAAKNNYDFIDKTGSIYQTGEMVCESYMEGETKKWKATTTNRAISLLDGQTYSFTEDAKVENGIIPSNHPFIAWDEQGPSRVTVMAGWDSTLKDGFDPTQNYNALTEADFVATKQALTFIRNDNSGQRGHTYVQFPAVVGPATVNIWIGTASDTKRSKNQNLECEVTPVVNGVAAEPILTVSEPEDAATEKRMRKYTCTYTGEGPVAFRVGSSKNKILHVYHVTIESKADASGIEDIIAAPADENAPIYNVMGVQVDENYKGIVIKNGKKYVQK